MGNNVNGTGICVCLGSVDQFNAFSTPALGGVSGQLHALAALPPEIICGTYCRLEEPHSRFERFGNVDAFKKISDDQTLRQDAC